MAKPPVTRERFRIHAEASKEQMGHVLAELTRLGLDNVGYELITDIKAWGTAERKTHATTAEQAITEYIKDNPTFAIGGLVEHFKAEGRTTGALYQAAKVMVKKKLLTRLGDGNYQRADVKAIAPPKSTEKKLKRPGNKVHRYEVMNKDVILKAIKGRAKFTVAELQKLFKKMKRNPKSVSAIIALLKRDKIITALDQGTYSWGRKPALASPKRNGAKAASRKEQVQAPEPVNLTNVRTSSEVAANG